MNTKILFNIDDVVKSRMQKRATKEGLTLTSVLTALSQAYAKEEVSVVRPVLIPNKKTVRLLRQADKDIAEGKNLSPAFTNVEDFIAYLDLGVKNTRKGK